MPKQEAIMNEIEMQYSKRIILAKISWHNYINQIISFFGLFGSCFNNALGYPDYLILYPIISVYMIMRKSFS
jgi:hypothetical protein